MARFFAWFFLACFAVGCAPVARVKVVMHLRPDQESSTAHAFSSLSKKSTNAWWI